MINGKAADKGASIGVLVTNINAVTADTGVTAEAKGGNLYPACIWSSPRS